MVRHDLCERPRLKIVGRERSQPRGTPVSAARSLQGQSSFLNEARVWGLGFCLGFIVGLLPGGVSLRPHTGCGSCMFCVPDALMTRGLYQVP